MAGAAYPKALYRPGTSMRVWNAHDVDMLTVADEDAHIAALDDGWSESPAGGEAPKRRGRPRKQPE